MNRSQQSGASVFTPFSSAPVDDQPAPAAPNTSTTFPKKPRPPKLYRIGEVVAYSGLSRQTVHNYTSIGLLEERDWTKGGHRRYDESVFQRLDRIAELKAQGKTLDEIRAALRGQDL